jgi:hypothetical protein
MGDDPLGSEATRPEGISIRWALEGLSTAYAAAVDDRDGDRLAALFVADGELVVPRYPDDLSPCVTRAGHAALRRVPEGLARYDRTFHVVTNHSYEVDGDRARGRVSCVAHHISTEGVSTGGAGPGAVGTDVVWYIRYADDYRRGDGIWRFTRRELHLQWVESRPVDRTGPPWPPDGWGQAGGTGWGAAGPA